MVHSTRVSVSLPTMQLALSEHEELEFGLLKPRPKSTRRHVRCRYKWAKKMLWVSPSKWRRTVFTNERRFFLDGPDGTACKRKDFRLPAPHSQSVETAEAGCWIGLEYVGREKLSRYCDQEDQLYPVFACGVGLLRAFHRSTLPEGRCSAARWCPYHVSQFTRE